MWLATNPPAPVTATCAQQDHRVALPVAGCHCSGGVMQIAGVEVHMLSWARLVIGTVLSKVAGSG
jgi:hypothetical protein